MNKEGNFMKKNEWATVRISDMNSLRYGLGHVDGKVVPGVKIQYKLLSKT